MDGQVEKRRDIQVEKSIQTERQPLRYVEMEFTVKVKYLQDTEADPTPRKRRIIELIDHYFRHDFAKAMKDRHGVMIDLTI